LARKNYSYEKRQRELEKQKKKERKRKRKLERKGITPEGDANQSPGEEKSD
jgi:hypothetical protein